MRYDTRLKVSIYAKRAALIARTPNFWPLAFEQAPDEIDRYIQHSDEPVFQYLKVFEVVRFEILPGPASAASHEGEPRSVRFTFEFEENEWFEDTTLEKTFWYRRNLDGWVGLVSEPVKITWKKGKDLTWGLLDLAVSVWEREQVEVANGATNGPGYKATGKKGYGDGYQDLVSKVRRITPGDLSFFAWFGYRGPNISAEESAEATRKEEENRKRVQKGETIENTVGKDLQQEFEVGDWLEREIFGDGEALAIALSDDFYPSATKYFGERHSLTSPVKSYSSNLVQAQEQEASESSTEMDGAASDGGSDRVDINKLVYDDSDPERPPSKKQKA